MYTLPSETARNFSKQEVVVENWEAKAKEQEAGGVKKQNKGSKLEN